MLRDRGFTLIELMVTVAIVAILAAIAYPSYASYVLRSKLSEGTNALQSYQVQIENYFQDNRSYASGGACGVPMPTGLKYFAVTGVCAGTTYTLTSTGNAQVQGMTYTLTQTNVRATTAGPFPTSATCWVIRADGTC